jgi:hypothetical protein
MANNSMLLRCFILATVACVTLVSVNYVRNQFIEPVAMGALCEKVVMWQCWLRDIAILMLQESRLGWGAFALVGVAYFTKNFYAALLAWCVACIGLVLYTPELCAAALLFAGLLAICGDESESQAGRAIHIQ